MIQQLAEQIERLAGAAVKGNDGGEPSTSSEGGMQAGAKEAEGGLRKIRRRRTLQPIRSATANRCAMGSELARHSDAESECASVQGDAETGQLGPTAAS